MRIRSITILPIFIFLIAGLVSFQPLNNRKIFDVHIHGQNAPDDQLASLRSHGVYKACISTSWSLQEQYRGKEMELLFGVMMPCPDGKVPYSRQTCFEGGVDYPNLEWVETQFKQGRIDFLGEMLSQYYGISSSDSSLFPYYRLASKYGVPIGMHTGSAGPDHGSPNFSEAMGDPELLRPLLTKFPKMKVWIMHGGAPYVKEALTIMKDFPNVYADISVINFPPIVPQADFESIVQQLIAAGLEDRIMFGSDNNDFSVVVSAVERVPFLSVAQKEKIFFGNAERFFAHRSNK